MKMRKVIATTLSAAMVLGTALPAMAASVVSPTTPAVDAPIYSFEVLQVIVPTEYAVAFNPGELTVKTGDTTTSTAQVLSKNYGIVNKSTRAMVASVDLAVQDLNTGANTITFVSSADEVAGEDDEYNILLQAVPANTAAVQVGGVTPTAPTKDTTAAELSDVTMTGATSAAVTMSAGSNSLQFLLEKAKYELKDDEVIELGETNTNNVGDKFELTELAANGEGVTAFTFTGQMNGDADWTKITNGIKITPTYTATAATDETIADGTGAMVQSGPSVTITPGGVITITGLTAETDPTDMNLIDVAANKAYNLTSQKSTWTATGSAAGGQIVVKLGQAWYGLAGKAVRIELDLKDGSQISGTTTLGNAPSND